MSSQDHTEKLFLAGIALAGLNCFEKADYNFPIYVLAALIWRGQNIKNPQTQQIRIAYLITFSLIVDFIWLIYWGTTYNDFLLASSPLVWMSKVVHYTMIISIIEFVLKIGILIYLVLHSKDISDSLSIDTIGNHVTNIFSQNNSNSPIKQSRQN